MSNDIPLHPEKGVNPHMTVCPGCGKEGDEIILVGANNCVLECQACNKKQLGKKRARKCLTCGAQELHFVREMDDTERLPSLCEECADMEKKAADAVKEGGVFWKCKDCGAGGAIMAESELAQNVRKELDMEPPKPCGIELSKANCPACGEQETK